MSSELRAYENPSKWRFTWEAQSHFPTLKLFLFNPDVKPSTHCKNLGVQVVLEQSLLRVSWFDAEAEVFLTVPIPRVLVDAESPIQFSALNDHVEVKLVLLLPVDHPILTSFDPGLSLSGDGSDGANGCSGDREPLSIDSDLKNLSSKGEVQFYCRSCSVQLTRSLRCFAEMPSTNWREAADNWFGTCCCSFGGISEKLVAGYANSYTYKVGMCLLSTTFLVLCKDDLVRCKLPCWDRSQKNVSEEEFIGHNCLEKAMQGNEDERGRMLCCDDQRHCSGNLSGTGAKEDYLAANLTCEVSEQVTNKDNLSGMSLSSRFSEDVWSAPGCCGNRTSFLTQKMKECSLETHGTSLKEQKSSRKHQLSAGQKSFMNGFLGDVFMAKPSNLTRDIQWAEFWCPHCSCLLGAYPSADGQAPLDGRIRLFKCYISTCHPGEGSNDLFRKYTLERMFANQLLENANHELSFRTVVRDLQTRSAMLQIVLLNSSLYRSSGYCFRINNTMELVEKVDLYPAIKVLFADCSSGSESQVRMVEDWVTKNQADEVYMLAHQIKELITCLNLAQNLFQLSYGLQEGFSLSSMKR